MGFLRKRVASRFPVFGRMADVALVSSAALRLANRRGLVSDEMAKKFGATNSSGGSGVSAAEMAMAGAAALRLARRLLRRRRS
ncbi:MAG: hypothetical protein ACI8TP_003736 [Acidimicrobiales bacterium]|jgi:hypothetical protein